MIHVCETCGGEGTVIEFRRFASEYMAGEPVEVLCLDCDGEGEFDDEPPARKPFVPGTLPRENNEDCSRAKPSGPTGEAGDAQRHD